jgi:hypothetical protein
MEISYNPQSSYYSGTFSNISLPARKYSNTKKVLSILNKVAHECDQNPWLQNFRVLVVMGKDEPDYVIPWFQKAIQQKNSSLIKASILEINSIGKIHFEKTSKIYEELLQNSNPQIQWQTILSLLELSQFYPQQVHSLLKNTLRYESTNPPKVVTKWNNKSFSVKKTKSTQISEVFPAAEISWDNIFDFIEYAKKNPCKADHFLLVASQNKDPHVKWAALLAYSQIIKLYPDQFSGSLSHLFKHNLLNTSFSSTRLLVELGKDDCEFDNLIPLFSSILDNKNIYLKQTMCAELKKISKAHPNKVFGFIKNNLKDFIRIT